MLFLGPAVVAQPASPAPALRSEDLRIESTALVVNFNPSSGAFSVADKRTGRQWNQLDAVDPIPVRKAWTDTNRILADLGGPVDFRVEIAFSASRPDELVVTLSADPAARFPGSPLEPSEGGRSSPGQFIGYPYPFAGDPKKGRHLYTRGPGLLLPVTGEFERIVGKAAIASGHAGAFFNWLGLVEGESGLAFYADTFEDCNFRWVKTAAADSSPPLFASQPCWLAEKSTWAYDRRVRYLFSNSGGYVSLAKWARQCLRTSGLLVTLAEKARTNPAVETLRGAPVVWVWLEGREDPGLLREMKAAGIANALIMFDPNHPPYPSPPFLQALKETGYQFGIYQYYGRQFDSTAPAFAHATPLDGRVHYRTPDFARYMTVRTDGKIWNVGRAAVPGGEQITFYQPSARFYTDYILEDVREIRAMIPATGLFYSDSFSRQAPFEDYSPEHPHNRRFDVAQRGQAIEKISALGLLSGAFANVSSWFLRVGHWSHGGMTVDELRGVVAPDGVYNMKNPKEDPAHWEKYLMKPYLPDQRMISHDFEPRVRVPLMELVAHDCIVSSPQWRDSAHRWGFVYWDYRDLWHILYGNVPLWNLSPDEWWRYSWRFAQCYRNVLGWHQKVFGAEMVDHKLLTADGQVQQSRFSNGWAVTVNFDPQRPYDDEGVTVAPMDFRPFQFQ